MIIECSFVEDMLERFLSIFVPEPFRDLEAVSGPLMQASRDPEVSRRNRSDVPTLAVVGLAT